MQNNNLPTYAIVELLIRLEKYNQSVGSYKNHAGYNGGVIVKTSGGSIVLSQSVIIKQFETPELISDDDLSRIADLFKSTN